MIIYHNIKKRPKEREIFTDDNPCSRGPLADWEPGDTEDGESALYHDAGPTIESSTHQTGPLQHRALQRDTSQHRAQGQAARPAQHHRPPEAPPGEDGVGEGDGQDADDQHDVVSPGHGGVAPTESHFSALSYGTPGVEYTGLETGKHRVETQDVPSPRVAPVSQAILSLHLTRPGQRIL